MSSLLPRNAFYVVSYPRSGNTWLINCLTMLLDGVRGEAFTPFRLYTELHGSPDRGFHFWCEPRQRSDQPICVKSHDDLPAFRRRHPPGAVVYIARDARDSLLSDYFFRQAYARAEELDTQRIHGTEILISRGASEPVFNPQRFTEFLRQEAPRLGGPRQVRQAGRRPLLPHLRRTDAEFRTQPAALAHIGQEAVQSHEETKKVYHTGFGAVFTGNNRDFFRRGQVGDWKNWYEPAHARLLDELIGPDLLAQGFEQDPAWAASFRPVRPAAQP